MHDFQTDHRLSYTRGEVIYMDSIWIMRPDKRLQDRVAQYFGNVSGYAVEETPTESG